MRVSGELSSTTRPGTPERVPWACAEEHSWGRRAGRPSEHPRARGHLPQGSARSAGLEKTSVGREVTGRRGSLITGSPCAVSGRDSPGRETEAQKVGVGCPGDSAPGWDAQPLRDVGTHHSPRVTPAPLPSTERTPPRSWSRPPGPADRAPPSGPGPATTPRGPLTGACALRSQGPRRRRARSRIPGWRRPAPPPRPRSSSGLRALALGPPAPAHNAERGAS